MPKISVIIPVYNVEKYLRACLDSVVNQTLKEVEIICVDDGSTDGSPAILAEYAAKDPRVKVITQAKSNAGAARNAGIAAAGGEYLEFVDADDWVDGQMFERMVRRAEETSAQIVFAPWTVHGGKAGSRVYRRKFPQPVVSQGGGLLSLEEIGETLFTSFGYCPWNKIVSRAFVLEQGIRFQEIPRANDLYFSCAVLALSTRIAVVGEPLYHYRKEALATKDSRTDRSPFCSLEALQAVKDLLDERGLYSKLSTAFRILAAKVCTTKPAVFLESSVARAYYDRVTDRRCIEKFELPGLTASQVGEHLFAAYQVMCSGGDYADYMRELMLSYRDQAEIAQDNHQRAEQNAEKARNEVEKMRNEVEKMRNELKDCRNGSCTGVRSPSAELSLVKRIRGVVKKFVPYFIMRHQVRRHDLELPVKGAGPLGRLFWGLVPYGLVPGVRPYPMEHGWLKTFPIPWYIRPRLRSIERARRDVMADTYVVTGQLNSCTNEAIDSMTFFEWLQNHGVPSKYVVWKKHPLYEKLMRGRYAKDVVGLKGNGVDDFEILKHREMFVRCRAFVQETAFLPHALQTWLRDLPGCRYVFLGHGPCGIATVARRFFARFNDFNATSMREKLLVDEDLSRLIRHPMSISFIGGMARYDKLRDESDRASGEFIVFVMFTWRDYFGDDIDKLKRSMYWQRIMELLSKTSRDRLAGKRIRLVVSLHHHLVNHMGAIDLGDGITLASTTEISYWIRHAHACVTDFSSVSFDFMFQHKPTLYWITDKDDPTLNPRDVNGGGKVCLAVSLQKNFYNICNSCEEVLRMLEAYASTGFALEPEKCSIADTYFAYRTDFCRHIYEEIEKRLHQ